MTRTRDLLPDLPTLLAKVRSRPGMYLGSKSIVALDHQLMGIKLAEDFHDIAEDSRIGGFDLQSFEAWVEEKLNPERLSVRSFSLARRIAGSDDVGLDLWFEWYDDFLRQHPKARTTR